MDIMAEERLLMDHINWARDESNCAERKVRQEKHTFFSQLERGLWVEKREVNTEFSSWESLFKPKKMGRLM